mmetsp:Transcript_9231/g.23103  ORF Transcript_9231/g.23103 Transcript_9231/m.23103 type:complete len:131 (-) Transcript_9231:791-1183(-)
MVSVVRWTEVQARVSSGRSDTCTIARLQETRRDACVRRPRTNSHTKHTPQPTPYVHCISDIIASRRTVAPPIILGDFGEDMDLMANPILTMPDFGEDMDLAANPVLTMYVPDFGDDIDLSANPVLTCKSA